MCVCPELASLCRWLIAFACFCRSHPCVCPAVFGLAVSAFRSPICQPRLTASSWVVLGFLFFLVVSLLCDLLRPRRFDRPLTSLMPSSVARHRPPSPGMVFFAYKLVTLHFGISITRLLGLVCLLRCFVVAFGFCCVCVCMRVWCVCDLLVALSPSALVRFLLLHQS